MRMTKVMKALGLEKPGLIGDSCMKRGMGLHRTLSTIRDLCITEKQLSATLIKSENLIVYEDRTNATEFLATSRAATGQEVSTVEDAENSKTDIREHHPINIAIHPRHIKQKANVAQAMKRDWFIYSCLCTVA